MLNVSPLFHSSITTFPRTISAQVEFDMIDVLAQGNCITTANSTANIGGVTQAVDGLTEIKNYMTEEPNYLLLDGSFFTPPKTTDNALDSVGWWSATISDVSGNFALPYPQLTLALTLPFNSLGLTFNFSDLSNNYCNSIQVITTDINSIQNIYAVPPTSGSYFWSQALVDIVNVSITFYSTNNPYRRVHMTEILFGDRFIWSGTNIFEVDLIEELDPLGNTATPKELSASIANNLNTFNIYENGLQKKQTLKYSLSLIYPTGLPETILMGTYYLYNWRNDNNFLSSTLYARDLLDIMTGTTFYSYNYVGTPISLYDLAVSIIQDFEAQSGIYFNYNVDLAFKNIYTDGVLPILSHHDALMLVAQAGMATMYVNRFNVFYIKQSISMVPINTMLYPYELTLNMQETYPKISTQDAFNYFTINVFNNIIADSPTTIYSNDLTINGTIAIWINYNNSASADTCLAVVTGGNLIAAQYYTNAAYLTINGSGIATIIITGNILTNTSVSKTVNNAGAQPINQINLNNPLVTDDAIATNILNWFVAECLNIYLYEVETWTDPSLEVGDLVTWDSQYYTGTKLAKIIRQEFRFSGTLAGSVNGKGS